MGICDAIRLARITPAHAGKRYAKLSRIHENGDHPRPCGEKPTCARDRVPELGSPPPMRGKVFKTENAYIPTRITPAHAGKRPTGAWPPAPR